MGSREGVLPYKERSGRASLSRKHSGSGLEDVRGGTRGAMGGKASTKALERGVLAYAGDGRQPGGWNPGNRGRAETV